MVKPTHSLRSVLSCFSALTVTSMPAAALAAEVTPLGGLETSLQWNPANPATRTTNLRGYDQRANSFTLESVTLGAAVSTPTFAGRLVLQEGTVSAAAWAGEPTLDASAGGVGSDAGLWRHIREAWASVRIVPDGAAPQTGDDAGTLTLSAGLFLSPIGPESLDNRDNWFWSRSNAFVALPAYHTGVDARLALGCGWAIRAGVFNGWNSVVDNNDAKSVMVQATYASDAVNASVLYFGGIERSSNTPEGEAWRHLFDANLTLALTDSFTWLIHTDVGLESHDLGVSTWFAGQTAVRLSLSEGLAIGLRADLVREWLPQADADEPSPSSILLPTDWLSSQTLVLSWSPEDIWSLRLEGRHDIAATKVFDSASARTQTTLTLGLVARL